MTPEQIDFWKEFQNTGSVADYLRFKQAAAKEETDHVQHNRGTGASGSEIS